MGRQYKGEVNLDPEKMWAISANGRYWVSESGDIINKATGFSLSPTIGNTGYHIISKSCTGQGSVHRLVYESFIGSIPEGMQINHLDGNKSNNHITNLELCTAQENTIHAYALGLSKGKKGETNSMAKVSEQDVINMYSMFLKGYDNSQVASIYGLSDRYVSLVRHGKRWEYLWDREGMKETLSTGNLPFSLPKCIYIVNYCKVSRELNRDIAFKFGLDTSTISRVKNRKTWKCIFDYCDIYIK